MVLNLYFSVNYCSREGATKLNTEYFLSAL